ncbi:YfhO family protein [Thermoflexus sp.]|uniref:YfhO family protein n=1 Tax=Thermoflexus sp. TaxID=1969742 RepID=UPI0035E45F5C
MSALMNIWRRWGTHREDSRRPWMSVVPALLWLTVLWWWFVWRYLTPVPADRLMLALGDFTHTYYVFRDLAYRALRAGEFPFRSLCLFSGYPYQAYPQSALFYPGTWLTLLLSMASGTAHASLDGFHLESLIHLWIAGAMAYLLFTRETGSRWGGLMGAIAFAFGGYMTGYPILQVSIVQTSAWTPLFLLGLRELAEGRRIAGALAAGVAGLFILLIGHPQMMLYSVLLGIAYFTFRLSSAERSLRWKLALQAVWIGALTLGTAAIQLFPTLEYYQHSNRVRLPFPESGSGFPIQDILQLLQPGLVSHWQPLYAGLLPLTLVLPALARGGRHARFWAGIALLGLLLSFGANFPLYDAFFQLVPFYATTRSQERHALWVSLALAALSAHGLAALLRGLPRARRWILSAGTRLSGAMALAFALSLPVVTFLARQGIDPSDHRRLPQEVGLSLLFALGTWGWWQARARGWRSRHGLALTALGLVSMNLAAFNRYLDAVPPAPIYPDHPAAAWMAPDPHRPFRFFDEYRLPDHYGCWVGEEDIRGATSIHPEPYFRFLKQTPEPMQWWLLGVRYVITWGRELPDMRALGRTATLLQEIPQGNEVTRIYRLDPPLPWAWVVRAIRPAKTVEEMLAALRDPAFRPAEEAVVLGPIEPVKATDRQAPDEVQLLRRTATEVRYRARLGQPGLLITRDPWYPGWTVTVNGHPAPLRRADGVLMAVYLPAGESEVVFRFRPTSFYVGAGVSGLTVFLLWPLTLWRMRRRLGPPATP